MKNLWHWIEDKWRWTICFWPQFWFHRAFLCPFGKHDWLVMYITDGSMHVSCFSWCRKEREPTEAERANHPNLHMSEEGRRLNELINELFPRKLPHD